MKDRMPTEGLPLGKNGDIIPGWAAAAGAAMMVGSLALVAFASATQGHPPVELPSAEIVKERVIAFRPTPAITNDVLLEDAETGETLVNLGPEEDGFVRSLERVLVFQRNKHRLSMEAPFRLTLHADRRLALVDTATGQVININAFGPDIAKVVAGLL
ncbi:MAG: photosynthetic complex assembly protein PuhC [Pseudomonadota bacterium]